MSHCGTAAHSPQALPAWAAETQTGDTLGITTAITIITLKIVIKMVMNGQIKCQ